jgi:hypothetical protein
MQSSKQIRLFSDLMPLVLNVFFDQRNGPAISRRCKNFMQRGREDKETQSAVSRVAVCVSLSERFESWVFSAPH